MPRTAAKVVQNEITEPLDLSGEAELVGEVGDDPLVALLARVVELLQGQSESLGRIVEAVEELVDVVVEARSPA